ncbi:MAG TPA: amidohydrolase family protein, partial [Planctomycetota bacterium]|nr:amidohydrolase family protein [Planctomycetota bacterium]
RSEGTELERAINETLEIGERAHVAVHVSHLKCTGRPNWDKITWLRERLFGAREAGVDVTADRYPYTASATSLDTLLPDWVHEGTEEDLLDRLSDEDTRERIREEVLEQTPETDWQDVMVASCRAAENRPWEGMRLAEVAREMRLDPFDALCELLIRDRGRTQGIFFRMSEENLEEVLRWPFVMIGSDGASRNVEKARPAGKPHPRCYGTATRVLGRYVREKGVLALENAVWKLSGLPAARLGLANRGLIAHNVLADLVVFDAATVGDRATYEDPHQYSVGIEHVLVNGVPTVTDGRHTGALAGRILTRGA